LCNRGEKPEVCLDRCRRPTVVHEPAAEPAIISSQPFFSFPSPATWTGVLVYAIASVGVMLVSFLVEAWTIGDGSFRVFVRAEHRPTVTVGPVHGHLQVCGQGGVTQNRRLRRPVAVAAPARHRSRIRLRPPPPPPDDRSTRYTHPHRFPGAPDVDFFRPPDQHEPWSARRACPQRGWGDAPSHSHSASSVRVFAPRHGSDADRAGWGREECVGQANDFWAEHRPKCDCRQPTNFPAVEPSGPSTRFGSESPRTTGRGAVSTDYEPLPSPTQSRTAAYRALRHHLVSDVVFSPRRLVDPREGSWDSESGFCFDKVEGISNVRSCLRRQDHLPRFGS